MAGCFFFANLLGFLFGPSQKGTICSSEKENLKPKKLTTRKIKII
jgi:hypothetical protein